jgi:hypothetical protein
MCVCWGACVRAGFVFVPTFEIQFCLSVFYAWDYSRCSHCCELLPVGISYNTVMFTDEFWQQKCSVREWVRKRKLATLLVSGKHTCAVTVNSFNNLEVSIGFSVTS